MRATPGLPNFYLLLLALGSVSLYADSTAQDSLGVHTLQSSVVQGSLFAQEGAGTVVLTSRDWEGKGLSLADLLSLHAGMQTRRLGGLGSFQGLSVRGMAGNRVVICIDGVPMSDASGGNFDFGAVDMNQLARVEVHRGQVPARLGGNGIGGVVNLVTKATGERGGRVVAGYGSHNTREISLGASGALSEQAVMSSTLSLRGSDNDYTYTDRNGTAYNTSDDREVRRQNSAYDQHSGVHRLSLRSGSDQWDFAVRHSQEEGGHPGQESQRTVTSGFARQWVHATALWQPGSSASEALPAMEIALGSRIEKSIFHWYFPLDGLGYASTEPVVVGSRSLGADAALRLYGQPLPRWNLQYHITGSGERLDPRDNAAASPLPRWQVRRLSLAGALESDWTAQPWLRVRLRQQHAVVRDALDGGVLQNSYKDTLRDARQLRLLHAWGSEVRLGPEGGPWSWHAGVSRSYRDPEAMERYGTRLGVLPNPDLEAEVAWSAESGWGHRTTHTRTQITGFYTLLHQGIIWLQSTSFTKPANLQRAQVRGLELESALQPFSWLDLSSHYTLQEARNLTNLDGQRDMFLPGEPLHSGGVQARLRTWGHLEWELQLQARSRLYRDAANRKRIPPEFLQHAYLSWLPRPGTVVRTGVLNLSGAEHQNIHSAFPAPGRQYRLSLSQNF